jgi:hypothetical protein
LTAGSICPRAGAQHSNSIDTRSDDPAGRNTWPDANAPATQPAATRNPCTPNPHAPHASNYPNSPTRPCPLPVRLSAHVASVLLAAPHACRHPLRAASATSHPQQPPLPALPCPAPQPMSAAHCPQRCRRPPACQASISCPAMKAGCGGVGQRHMHTSCRCRLRKPATLPQRTRGVRHRAAQRLTSAAAAGRRRRRRASRRRGRRSREQRAARRVRVSLRKGACVARRAKDAQGVKEIEIEMDTCMGTCMESQGRAGRHVLQHSGAALGNEKAASSSLRSSRSEKEANWGDAHARATRTPAPGPPRPYHNTKGLSRWTG